MNRIERILQEKKWRQGLLPIAITGDEKIDVSALTRALAEGIRRGGDAVVTLREEDFSADEAADILRTISFDGSASCVLIKDLLFSKMPAGERAKLIELLDDDTAVGCLIVSQPTAQDKAGDKAAREVLSQFERRGVSIRCDLKKPHEIAEALAARAGGRMSRSQCQALLTRCGGSYAAALQEQDKVLSYAAGRSVEGADIELIVTEELTASAFEISRKLLAGDLGGALQKADALFQRRESEIMMLAAISTAFIDLQRAKASGGERAFLTATFPAAYRGREFRVDNALQSARRYSEAQIDGAVEVLWGCDLALKSSRLSPRIELESALCRVHRILRSGRA